MKARLIIFSLFIAVASATTATAQKKKGFVVPEGVTVTKDIDYVGDKNPRQMLDLYLPETDEPLPLVIWVHGGGWLNGSKERPKNAFLLSEGFAVASIGYRLTQEAQWPSQIEDCQAAIRWLRSHAEEYGLDPEKFGIMGSSAGGHLVALVGTRPLPENEAVSSRVQAVCDWFGPSDLLTMPPNVVSVTRTREQVASSNGAKLLGIPIPDAPEKAKDASAFYQVSANDPPFLIMHGSEDPGVPIEQSQKLHNALKTAGVDSTFVIVEGAGHGGKEFNEPDVTEEVTSFFSRVLK